MDCTWAHGVCQSYGEGLDREDDGVDREDDGVGGDE